MLMHLGDLLIYLMHLFNLFQYFQVQTLNIKRLSLCPKWNISFQRVLLVCKTKPLFD